MNTFKQRFLLLPVGLAFLFAASPSLLHGADANEEQQFISVLQSGASPQEKDTACAGLKRIGTVKSIPALAGLLEDEQLSHSARYALESMPFPEAGQALVEALAKTSAQTKVGIISSLGCRAEEHASPALEKLLTDSDREIATAAAAALGWMGDQKALMGALAKDKSGSSSASAGFHAAVVDAVLHCANLRLAAKDRSAALNLFRTVYDTEKEGSVRSAAYRGMILSSSDNAAVSLMTKAITGKDSASQLAALQLVHDAPAAEATKAVVRVLPTVNPPIQASLIEGLAQRGDASATAVIAKLADSPSPEVRVAALKALDLLGDAATVPLLAQSAASSSDEEERTAARQALVDINRGNITAALLAQLTEAAPAVQAEAARALGERGDPAALSPLQDLARQGSDSARKAAFQALAELVDAPQLSVLVQLVIEAKSEAARAQAAEALNSACQRIQSWRGRLDLAPLAAGLASDSVQVRAAMLPVCSGLSGPETRAALRSAVTDPNMVVRAAGIRALCDTGDAELLPDVARVACEAPEENFRVLAIAACTRLMSPEQGAQLSNGQRIAVFEPMLKTSLNDEQKRLVLAGLGEVSDPKALDLVQPLLGDAAVQAEAAQAVIKISMSLPPTQAQQAAEALKKVVAATASTSATHAAAAAALKQIEESAGYIAVWQAAGPYAQEGKECTALFDIVFPPELENGQGADWKPLPAGADPKRPWVMDLLKAFGGEQRVAYARTWVHTDQAQSLRLEMGSDDGVKAWLNHNLIHADNALRALEPGSDKVDVTLNAGWNQLLLKVTQFNQGWAFCARLVKPDGSLPAGLEFDASGEKAK